MADITKARIVGDWRRVIGDEIVSHETTEVGDAGIHGTVTLSPVWARGGPQGVIADPGAHYSIHPVECRVRYGRLYDPTNTHPYEDVVVEIDGQPLVWEAKFNLAYRRRTGEKEVPLTVKAVTFDSSAMVAGQIALTGILPAAAIPDAYKAYFADAALSANTASEARDVAVDAADTATGAAVEAVDAADVATAAVPLAKAEADRAIGLANAQDEHIAGTLEDPNSATHAAFKAVGNATYGTKAEVAEKLDESALPTKISADQAVRDEVALAGIAPSSMSLAASVLARNAATTPLPPMIPLVTGVAPEETSGWAGTTAAIVPSPTDQSRTVWKLDGDGSATNARLAVSLTGISIPNPSAITAWVYLPDPAAVSRVRVNIESAAGSWSRDTSEAPAQVLRQGWNMLRWQPNISNTAAFQAPTAVWVRVYSATSGAPIRSYVGPVVIEARQKASLVVINDWGSKPFYDNAYPGLKAAGIPVTWALRVSRLGTGTYPDNHVSIEEARQLMDENNNVVSFHSWDGSANSGLSPAQARDVALRAQAGLASRGLWSEGAVHRPAWVQNLAPNAHGAFPHLVTSAMWNDSYGISAWPPPNRLNIIRASFRNQATLDGYFTLLEQHRGAGLFYTHGVVPDAEENANHASLTQWNYFMGKVQAALAAGWLEAVTIPQLVERERLVMPTHPPVVRR